MSTSHLVWYKTLSRDSELIQRVSDLQVRPSPCSALKLEKTSQYRYLKTVTETFCFYFTESTEAD